MIATVSVKGQTVIPEAICEQARIKAGDQLDVGYANGLIVMRKRKALTPARVRSLILGGRELPEMTSADETTLPAPLKASADGARNEGCFRHEHRRECEFLAREAV